MDANWVFNFHICFLWDQQTLDEDIKDKNT